MNGSIVSHRELPLLKGLLDDSKLPLAIWLAPITMHRQMLYIYSGAHGDQLLASAVGLIGTFEDEVNGVDTSRPATSSTSTDLAVRVFGFKAGIARFQKAIQFTVDTLASVFLTLYSKQLSHQQRTQLGEEINHFSARLGLIEEIALIDRVSRFHDTIHYIVEAGHFTEREGAERFWEIIGHSDVLAYFGNMLEFIDEVKQSLILVVRRQGVVNPYNAQATQLIKELTDE